MKRSSFQQKKKKKVSFSNILGQNKNVELVRIFLLCQDYNTRQTELPKMLLDDKVSLRWALCASTFPQPTAFLLPLTRKVITSFMAHK